jgi:MFS family permease
MLLMISWGYAADRLGRKPVLVFSLAGVSIATALFGLSKTVWQMIVFRCFAGVFAGTVVYVVHSRPAPFFSSRHVGPLMR